MILDRVWPNSLVRLWASEPNMVFVVLSNSGLLIRAFRLSPEHRLKLVVRGGPKNKQTQAH